ncbi:Trichodiene synthase, partial [Termitomyces sp. T112]
MPGCLNVPCTPSEKNIAAILKDFLHDHEMFSTYDSSPCATNEELEKFMRNEIEVHNLPANHMNKILHLAASLIELAYHDCTFDEKKQIALYNWYLIYIDDVSSKDISTYIAFQERFIRKLPQLDPVLDRLASVLHAMFDFYPVFFANSIISATFEFVSGTCIEPSVEKLELSSASTRFPWFLRDRTGVAVAFALMLFPKSRQVDYVTCFQVMADMDFWISATNDLLSYHKESIAGETANYISNRAVAE